VVDVCQVERHSPCEVRQDLGVPEEPAFGLADFDRYVEGHGIPEEDYPAAFALSIAQHVDGRVPTFEKVEREAPADGVVIEGDDLSPRARQ
jgi:hypothetical protein